jgi:hypothetical protein
MRITCPAGRALSLNLFNNSTCTASDTRAVYAATYLDLPAIRLCFDKTAQSYQITKEGILLLSDDLNGCATVTDRISYTLPLEVPPKTTDIGSTSSKCLVSDGKRFSAYFACDRNSANKPFLKWMLVASCVVSLLFQ